MPTLFRLPRAAVPAAFALSFAVTAASAQSASTAPARVLPTPSPEQRAAVDSIFAPYNSTTSPGCLVGANLRGASLYRGAYGMADLERGIALRQGMMAEIGSVSKQFVAASLVLLAQEGKLSLDDPVAKHIAGFPEFRDLGGPVTVRHLLQHVSGVRDQYGLLELVGRPYGEVVHTNAEVVALVSRQRTLNFPVQSAYLYSNSGYTVAATVAERVSGESFQSLTTSRLFLPAGMQRAQWRTDFRDVIADRVVPYARRGNAWAVEYPFSNLYGAGGLLTTIDDMLRWTEALHAGRIGSGGTLAEMTRVPTLTDGSQTEYGLGLMVRQWRGVREIAHSGSTAGYRAYLAHYPAQGLSVAMQCNAGNGNYVQLGRAFAAVFLGDALQSEVPPAPSRTERPRTVALDARARRVLTGRWQDAETGAIVTLVPGDSGLVLRVPPDASVAFTAIGSDSLVAGGRALGLVRDRRGNPIAFHYHAGRVQHIRFTKVSDR